MELGMCHWQRDIQNFGLRSFYHWSCHLLLSRWHCASQEYLKSVQDIHMTFPHSLLEYQFLIIIFWFEVYSNDPRVCFDFFSISLEMWFSLSCDALISTPSFHFLLTLLHEISNSLSLSVMTAYSMSYCWSLTSTPNTRIPRAVKSK